MKYGLNIDGRKCGPIDPAKVNETDWTWHDTESERDAAIPGPTTDEVKASCLADIDASAESARQRFVTPGNYQPSEYERAREEAEAYQAGTISSSAALQADVDAGTIDPRTGSAVADQSEAADLILYRRDNWMGSLDNIRAERLKGKANVRSAYDTGDVSGMRTARDNAVAALDAIGPS